VIKIKPRLVIDEGEVETVLPSSPEAVFP